MRSFQVAPGQNANAQQFSLLRADARGGSFLLAQQMLGYFSMGTNPTNGKTWTLTINGNAVAGTFVSGTPTNPGDVKIGLTAPSTVANWYALLAQPQTTTSTGVALSTSNQQFLSYLSYAVPSGGTTLYILNNNTNLYAPLSSLSASTNATSDSFTSQTLQLYVHAGTVYVNGTRVLFLGGATPTVTAPSTNPRIDVLTIDNAGTLAWTTGTEASSPTVATYPANKAAICELYNVVAETALYDFDYKQSSQGYIYNDVRPFLQFPFNPTALVTDLIPSVDGGQSLGSPTFEWANLYAKTAVYVNGIPIGSGKFGGTGADGALSISSGTTTVDCANAAIVVKNYTSISITGTGKLAFINPNANGTIIILKSQGGVTLTSSTAPMIDASGMGAAGGAALTFSTGGASTVNGNTGNPGFAQIVTTNAGTGAGLAGAAASVGIRDLSPLLLKYPLSWVGAGAGSGQVNSSSGISATSGAGGNGGGELIIECAGAWDFTTSSGISVAGAAGGNGTTTSSTFAGAAGGGGGGGGFFLALYGSLTANTGTVIVSGGTGGTSSPGSGGVGGGGGSNAHALGANGTTSAGGSGATGLAVIAQNTEYA